MLDAYLKRQNRYLTVVMILVGISLIVGTIFLLSQGCTKMAIAHASVSLSIMSSFGCFIQSNRKYIAQCASIANIERNAINLDGEDGVKVINDTVPDLGFKFHRD